MVGGRQLPLAAGESSTMIARLAKLRADVP
jgi:hypothetical protein